MPGNPKFTLDPEKKAAMLAGIAAGHDHATIAKASGVSMVTVKKYASRATTTVTDGMTTVERAAPPDPRGSPRAARKKRAPRAAHGTESSPKPKAASGTGPLSDKEGKRIVRAAFSVVALFLGNGWTLEPPEIDEIGPTLAEASDVLPGSLRQVIRRYFAPLTLAAQLGAVTQNRVAEAQRQAEGKQTVNPAYSPPPPAAPPPPPNGLITPPGMVSGRIRDRN